MKTKNTLQHILILLIGVNLPGCAYPPKISGFRPVYPEMVVTPKSLMTWIEVDSLTPTLRWQPYPGEHQDALDSEAVPFILEDLAEISDKQYDLFIAEIQEDMSLTPTYEAERLSQPYHTVEKALKPDAKFIWSIRARYKINGQARLSEWSKSNMPFLFYRFKTPAE